MSVLQTQTKVHPLLVLLSSRVTWGKRIPGTLTPKPHSNGSGTDWPLRQTDRTLSLFLPKERLPRVAGAAVPAMSLCPLCPGTSSTCGAFPSDGETLQGWRLLQDCAELGRQDKAIDVKLNVGGSKIHRFVL